MSEEFYLCLDVGGTEIKVNLLNREQKAFLPKDKIYPSHASQDKQEILDHFESIVKSQLSFVHEQNGELRGVGIAFPGPFDYKNGISLIQGLRKYDAIYQVNLKPYFRKWLVDMDFLADLPLLFENDATAFSIGEYFHGAAQTADKAIFITLGTGCGSTFIESGQPVKNKYGVQDHGMIYEDPFLDGTIDDYLSAKGLKFVADRLGISGDGRSLYQAAEAGSKQAKQVFHEFGYLVGTGLKRYVQIFQPDCIVFGGQISKSMNWMRDGIRAGLAEEGAAKLEIKVSENGTLSTFRGIVHLLKKNHNDRWD